MANWKDLALKEVGPGVSQVLPVNGNQRLVGFLGVSDDLGDAVLMPQTLNLLVTLQTKMEGIPTPAPRNKLKRKVLIRINRYTLNGHYIRSHLCICLLTHVANQPITWLHLNAFRHVDTVKTTC